MTSFEKPVVATVSDKLGRFCNFPHFKAMAVLHRLSDYILIHFVLVLYKRLTVRLTKVFPYLCTNLWV